jgi:hypothetical protein
MCQEHSAIGDWPPACRCRGSRRSLARLARLRSSHSHTQNPSPQRCHRLPETWTPPCRLSKQGDTMLRSVTALLTFWLLLSSLVSASAWDDGLDGPLLGDRPAPTSPPLGFNGLYESLAWGSVPVNKSGVGSQKRSPNETRLGRLDIRQSVSAYRFEFAFYLPSHFQSHLP